MACTFFSLFLSYFQHCAVKHTPKASEEEVGAFTKLIEAMGFTGPLKYNKWVKLILLIHQLLVTKTT